MRCSAIVGAPPSEASVTIQRSPVHSREPLRPDRWRGVGRLRIGPELDAAALQRHQMHIGFQMRRQKIARPVLGERDDVLQGAYFQPGRGKDGRHLFLRAGGLGSGDAKAAALLRHRRRAAGVGRGGVRGADPAAPSVSRKLRTSLSVGGKSAA